MQITTRGWDNIYVPDKVFIERLTPAYNTEYSDTAPAYIENFFNGEYGCQNYLSLFYSLPEIFAPVHEIASRVSDAIWQLKNFSDDIVSYSNSDFNRLFSQPNPSDTIRALIYQAVCYEIVIGKNFFYKNNPTTLSQSISSVVAWFNLCADKTTAEMWKNTNPYTANKMSDIVKEYKEPDGSGGYRYFDVKNVLPVINYSLRSPKNMNSAQSMLKGADRAIKNLIPVYEARGVIYIKRGALGFLVSLKSDETGRQTLTPKEKASLRKDADDTYGLSRSKSTIGITDIPVDFVRTSMSIDELKPFDETLADATAIYSVLRVPKHLIPSKDQSTYANAGSDMKSFYSDVIIPWAKRYADLFTTWFGFDGKSNYKQYIYANFDHIDILQENKKDKAGVDQINGNVYLQRFMNGVDTLNAWRSVTGNNALPLSLYNKTLFEMTPEEISTVKAVLNLKMPTNAAGIATTDNATSQQAD